MVGHAMTEGHPYASVGGTVHLGEGVQAELTVAFDLLGLGLRRMVEGLVQGWRR